MNWKNLLGDAAPVLGGILGGPAGAAVGGLVAKALGVGDTEQDLATAVQKDPSLIVKLRELETTQATHLADLRAQLSGKRLDIIHTYAASPSIFKSGGRPAILWVCAAAFAWTYFLSPVGTWMASLAGVPVTVPQLDMSALMPLLFALLGVGGMQSYERAKGVSNETKGAPAAGKH